MPIVKAEGKEERAVLSIAFFFFLIYLFKNFLKLEANYFTVFWWFLPYINMNQPWVYMSHILHPPPTSLPIPSLRVVPMDRPWVPCLVHQTGLVICFTYGNIYVSMLFSQIISPSPSPTESKSLFFISVSLLLSCI